jgi:hypothetical protein
LHEYLSPAYVELVEADREILTHVVQVKLQPIALAEISHTHWLFSDYSNRDEVVKSVSIEENKQTELAYSITR